MNLPVTQSSTDLNLHILLKSVGSEQFIASVAELNDCQVTASTREAAIEALQQMIQSHLIGTEIIPFSVIKEQPIVKSENPWIEFIGMYKNDPDFAEIMTEMRSERNLEPHPSIERL